MSQASPQWRAIIREQLETLASESEQLAYESRVPNVDITAELIAGWFDDSYHPDEPSFSQCFNAAELTQLANFSSDFDQQLSRLPKSGGTVRTWLATEAWRKVMSYAAETAKTIAV